MNILEKITKLREDHHWSEYQLAEKSGLTQSTISSWYRKNMLPSITSLSKICDAFGITLSQFFLETDTESIVLRDEQLKLLNAAAKLDSTQYNALLTFLQTL